MWATELVNDVEHKACEERLRELEKNTNTLKYKETVRKLLMFVFFPKYSSEVTKVMLKGSLVRLFEC